MQTHQGGDGAGGRATPPWPSARLVVDPLFGPFLLGRVLSTAGIWVHNTVAAILMFQMTGSAVMVGMVSVAQFLPQLLLAPLSGAMADRGDRRRQLVAGRVIAAAGSAGLATWIWLGHAVGGPGPWAVIVAALVVGTGFVVGGPAMNALVPSLVRPRDLAAAVALSSAPVTIARAAGPVLGVFVAVKAGHAAAFAIAAAGNVVFALLLIPLPIASRAVHVAGRDLSVRGGFRHVRQDPVLLVLLGGIAAVSVGADPAITLTPSLSHAFGQGVELVGVFASSFGAGAALGFVMLPLVAGRFGLVRLAEIGLLLLSGGSLALAVARAAPLAIAAFAVAGVGMTLALTSLTTQIQQRVPDGVRGRVMALWSIAFLGSRPFAAAVDGAVAEWLSVEAALVAVSLSTLAAACWCRPARLSIRGPEV